MSVALKRGISAKDESRKCAGRFWRLFPHLLLCLSLVAYAALGALMFERIEGKSGSSAHHDSYLDFLGQIVSTVQNLTVNNSSYPEIVGEVEIKMDNFKSIWFQRPKRWDFFGSMFFCCTVFTTVALNRVISHLSFSWAAAMALSALLTMGLVVH